MFVWAAILSPDINYVLQLVVIFADALGTRLEQLYRRRM